MKATESTVTAVRPAEEIAYLTGREAHFSRSPGGLLALTLVTPEGERRYDRVVVLRAFPLTAPEEFLSVRDARDTAHELGIIRRLADLDEEGELLVRAELDDRYFVPRILRIFSLHRRGAVYMDADTDRGRRTLMIRDDASGIRLLDGGRVFITDIEGNNYEIPDPKALDKASYRRIEIYL